MPLRSDWWQVSLEDVAGAVPQWVSILTAGESSLPSRSRSSRKELALALLNVDSPRSAANSTLHESPVAASHYCSREETEAMPDISGTLSKQSSRNIPTSMHDTHQSSQGISATVDAL